MRGYNKAILMGNLPRDPALKQLPSDTSCCEFGIALNRKWRDSNGDDKEDTTFVDCTAFGKTGELINEHFAKGKPIMIEGRLKYDSWEDEQSGAKRSKLSVVVESFTFVGGPPGGGGDGGHDQGDGGYDDRQQQAPPQRQQSQGNSNSRGGGGQQNRPQQRQGNQQRQPAGSGRRDSDVPF
jgi:single-strand DNA-binding protein